MPQSVTGAAFVLGVILIIAALVGKEVKIAAVELPALERQPRFIVGMLGALLIYVGLFDPVSTNLARPEPTAVAADSTLAQPAALPVTPSATLAALTATPQEQVSLEAADISGAYRVIGAAANGDPYGGILQLSKRGVAYQLAWRIPGEYDGVGLAQTDILSVGYGVKGEACSVSSYRVQSDGSLDGRWLALDGDIPGSERNIPTSDVTAGIAGSYRVIGINPNGSSYQGALTVTERGPTYEFVWKTGGATIIGVAIRQGDIVSVGWGTKPCGVISYRIDADGTLRGMFSAHGFYLIGTEDAVRE